ncbi:tyrosine-protein phosphatase [Plantactinospora sp. S1510]|uniref:Tyrosine-protein phosphatase n=1 Tax=Plantactinospora alkalitolerans TaxID=2789879 RepID=A0ABS0GQ39_9ACTN|nr:tyrosine-protein phosphatase [Plantactinospora alkalitolerans]MBF9128317.1 tyrosine-protein phosphatase [Plantactinospora alkalitolerans]
MTIGRHLDWAGCLNIRDLGGLPTGDGRTTRWRAVVRADNLDRLTPDGWAALHAYGVRTVVDLREDDERSTSTERPAGIDVVHVPLDDSADTDFWYRCIDDEIDGTPLYYRPFLDRKPERCVAAVAAVARAGPGVVVVHCGIGRDRTGLASLLLLALVGVTPDAIVADYALSGERLEPYFAEARAAHGDVIGDRLARRGTTVPESLHAVLAGLDAEARLRAAGLAAEDLQALRARLAPVEAAAVSGGR